MKKVLSGVLAASLALSSFASIAFGAELTAQEKFDALKEKGIFAGYVDGSAGLDKTMTRAEVSKVLVKLLGLTEDASAATYSDLDGATWAVGFIGAASKAGIMNGVGGGKFDPSGTFTTEQLAAVLARALDLPASSDAVAGNVDEWAKGYVAAAIKAGLLTKADDYTAPALRELLVAATYAADAVVNPAPVAAIASVKASGAKKITVSFNGAVDSAKAVISVKKGSTTANYSKVTFADDKKSADIEFATNLTTGEYTVSVAGLTTAALSKAVTVEAEKLAEISFLSDVAVISGVTVTTNAVAKNQYGEDVTAKLALGTVSVTTSKGTSATVNNKGKVTVTNGSAYTVGEKVVVTIVDSASGLVASKTLTVAQAADVKTIDFGNLTTDNADLKDAPINVTAFSTNAADYYLPITVKDQYGNVLDAASLAGVTVLSSNSDIVKLAATPIVDKDGVTVLKFQTTAGTRTYGTAVITVVSAATGVTANKSIQVLENSKLDSVKLEAPASDLKISVATVLPVSVTDTYGKDIALKDLSITGSGTGTLTLATGTTISAINATLSVETDYVKNTSSIKVTPTAKNVILTATTVTGKSQTLSLAALDAPVVSGIKGIKSDFVSLLANDVTLTTALNGNVEFVDQYGADIAAPAYDAADTTGALDYTIAEKDAANAVTTFAAGTITASTTAGTETYVVTLKNATGDVLDTREVTVTVVDATKITKFGINDLDKFYTEADANATHTQNVDIYGLVDGKKVLVNQSMAKDFEASNGLTGINSTTGAFVPQDVNTDSKDVTSTIRVLVEAGDNTYTVTKDVVYSNAAPKAASLAIELDGAAAPDAVQITPVNANNIVTAGTDGLKIYAKDQYGKVIETSTYKFVVTNNTTGANITIASDGAVSVPAAPTVGKSFLLTVTIDGISKTVKVVIG